MGWVGSVALTEALGDAACGCDLAERADDEPDARGAAVLRADAEQCRAEWRCPRLCPSTEPLPEKQREALDRVRRLCGAEEGEITVCPGALVRRPEAHRVVTALRWLRAGALHLRNPHPTLAEVEALDLAQDSLAARERDELRRAEARTKGRDHG